MRSAKRVVTRRCTLASVFSCDKSSRLAIHRSFSPRHARSLIGVTNLTRDDHTVRGLLPCPALLHVIHDNPWLDSGTRMSRSRFSFQSVRWHSDQSKKEVPGSKHEEEGVTGQGGDGTSNKMSEKISQRLTGRVEGMREDLQGRMKGARAGLDDNIEAMRDAAKEGRLRQAVRDRAKEGKGRLGTLLSQYGVVGIGCYMGIYASTLGVLYVVYDFGLMTNLPEGGGAVIEKFKELMTHTPEWMQGFSNQLFEAMESDHRARSLVLAWATCKVLEPARLLGAIAMTPRLARWMGYVPPKPAVDKEVGAENEGEGEDKKKEEEGVRGHSGAQG